VIEIDSLYKKFFLVIDVRVAVLYTNSATHFFVIKIFAFFLPKMHKLYVLYFQTLIRVLFLLAVAIGVTTLSFRSACVLNRYCSFTQDVINYIGVFGITCDFIAVYGILGWKVKAPHDEPWVQKMNQRICSLFIALGFICGALAYLLQPVY
jgi:hypothetical protein